MFFLTAPTGTVTYHRQVLKKSVYLEPGESLSKDEFICRNAPVDSTTPLEEAPQGVLQLDFANRNIGGGALDRVMHHQCSALDIAVVLVSHWAPVWVPSRKESV